MLLNNRHANQIVNYSNSQKERNISRARPHVMIDYSLEVLVKRAIILPSFHKINWTHSWPYQIPAHLAGKIRCFIPHQHLLRSLCGARSLTLNRISNNHFASFQDQKTGNNWKGAIPNNYQIHCSQSWAYLNSCIPASNAAVYMPF